MAKPNFKLLDDFDNSFFKNRRIMSGTGIPSTGTYKVGDIIISETQTEDFIGWVCTTDGQPGTWIKFGHKGDVGGDVPEIDLTPYALKLDVGDKGSLTTQEKTSLVAAINEIKSISDSAKQRGDEVKSMLVDKLISVGTEASTSEEFESLINKVQKGESHNLPSWYNLTNMWCSCEDMPKVAASTTSVTIDNIVYIFGYLLGEFILFDINTGKFSKKANTITQRKSATSSIVDGLVYYIGGFTGSMYTNINEVYDPKTEQVTTKATMPTSRQAHVASVINKCIYCIGGGENVDPTGINEMYDTITNTWHVKAADSRQRSYACSVVLNDKIYVIGGEYNGNMLNNNTCYDPLMNTWTSKANLPATKTGAVAEVVDGIIYCVGGTTVIPNSTCVYNPTTNSWTTKADMAEPKSYCSSAVFGKNVFVFGGMIRGQETNKAEFYVV